MTSEIYNSIQDDVPKWIRLELETALDAAVIDRAVTDSVVPDSVLRDKKKISIFFRADDIAVYSRNYQRLVSLFIEYNVPICMAVVPSWLTVPRWEAITRETAKYKSLFCWHMHGFRHSNHEARGKKQEFGPSRSRDDLYQDLMNGKKRLETIVGQEFERVFTPPWNRCSNDCMQILKQMGFKAISRSRGSKPISPEGLKDFQVQVDLHTRKEFAADQGWTNLLTEFKQGLTSESCGIMIHHMRMNESAFIFLECLLQYLTSYRQIEILTYRQMI